jgi:hypothetical protein
MGMGMGFQARILRMTGSGFTILYRKVSFHPLVTLPDRHEKENFTHRLDHHPALSFS